MLTSDEARPVPVCSSAKQTGDTYPQEWDWVERSIWTERMLEALQQRVKGGVWFSLIDPNKFFQDLGLFNLEGAHRALFQSS